LIIDLITRRNTYIYISMYDKIVCFFNDTLAMQGIGSYNVFIYLV